MYKRINDVFPNWMSAGIFTALNNYNVPWKSTVQPSNLDIAYHGGKSGNKIISPLIERFIDEPSGELSTENVDKIASMIFTVYGTNWGKLFETLSFDYNPIENYSMIETETGTETDTGTETGTGTIERTGTNAETHTGTDNFTSSSTGNNTSTNNNSVFGFNSSDAVGSDAQTGTGTMVGNGTNNETRDMTDTETRNTTDTETRNFATSGNRSNNRTLTRAGNIGITTSQQMIESERELWNWFFYDIVFNNIDAMLTLTIY